MIDPTGYILTTIRDAPTVAALTDRVRAARPKPETRRADGTLIDPGDAQGPGAYQRFVVIVRLGYARARRLAYQDIRWTARCYGVDERDAAALAGAVSDAIHGLTPRVSSGGIGIWASFDEQGGVPARDPVTDQPYESVVIRAVAADRPIA